jgi:DNA-binding winged helix-turn-helix (wHTH) protein
VVRFGLFELNTRTGELRKQGLRIRLSKQPFQVLSLLLEHPGRLRTREELKHKLWPEDTYVDFDRSLNKAVHAVRGALGDSADNPHYIETVSRHGYRFIGMGAETFRQTGSNLRGQHKIDSIAVLPIECDMTDLNSAVDEITIGIIDNLSRLRGVRVLAYGTIRHYKGRDVDAQTMGRDMDVAAVLVGCCSFRGESFVLHIELIDVLDGSQIWGEQVRRSRTEIIKNAEPLAQQVCEQLQEILARNVNDDVGADDKLEMKYRNVLKKIS